MQQKMKASASFVHAPFSLSSQAPMMDHRHSALAKRSPAAQVEITVDRGTLEEQQVLTP